ncbi:MAG: hypothetical protein P4N59_05410, partial [Negativicutes bacterium]|nr:hypothetical protein [Negativicutes bacterium]
PVQGRWLSPDPAGLGVARPNNPQTWNRYAYVGNKPLQTVDSLGLGNCMGMTQYDCQLAIQESNFGGGDGFSSTYVSVGGTNGNGTVYSSITVSAGDIFDLSQSSGTGYLSLTVPQNGGDGGSSSPNNGTSATPTQQRPKNCGAAIALGAGSVGFDVLGMIPGLGNMISAGAAGGRIATGIAYAGAGYGIATGLHDEAPYGAASAGAGLGLTFADAAIAGGKVIPVLGNALSFATGLYDGYQLGVTISKCW